MLSNNNEEAEKDREILIVEDDEMTLSVMERSFQTEEAQFRTTLGRSLKEALSLMEQSKFDAIVADYHLNDGTASALMSKAKDTPFVVVTSDDDPALAAHLVRNGVDEFVSKDAKLRFVNTLPIIVESAIERRREIENYKKEQKRFKELFENSSVLIQSLDGSGYLIYANSAWLRSLGYQETELNALHYLDVIHPFDHKYAKNLYTKIGPGVRINNVNLRFVDKKGDITYVNGTVNCTDDQRPFQIHGMFNNITEEVIAQKRLSRSEKKYRELVEMAEDTICRIDFKGYFRFVNEHGEELTGYDRRDLVGSHCLSLVDPNYKDQVARHYNDQHTNKKKSTYMEFPLITKGGKRVWVGQKTTEYKKGRFIRGYQLVVRDITEKKLAEEKILEQKKELEAQRDVLEEQNETIRENYDQLRKARISRRAVIIVLLLAVALFVLSEIFLEPLIEEYVDGNYAGLMLKGTIALLLKPLETFVENYLTKRSYKHIESSI